MSETIETSPAPLGVTPSQTVGPFLHLALADPAAWAVVTDEAPGAIIIGGRVLDGAGAPVPDGVVETWQVDPSGRPDATVPREHRSDSPFAPAYFSRCPTDVGGRWRIRTLKPGPVPTFGGRLQAPHVMVSVLARGLLDRVVTRIYFDNEPDANAADPVLALLPEADRDRLIANRQADGDGYELDLVLQGDGETPFFTI